MPSAATPAQGPHTAPTDPADWEGLWSDIVYARVAGSITGSAAGSATVSTTDAATEPATSRAPSRLTHCVDRGWTLKQPCSPASAELFQLYKPLLDARHAHAGRPDAAPWWLAQLGQSLDGCVATATGDSYFVTGPQSLQHLHRLRALCDAVLVGAGTVAADNPQLTTRRVPGPHPVRVLLDPAARLHGSARALRDGQAPTWWLCDARHAETARARLRGVQDAAPGAAEVVAVADLIDPREPTRGYDPARVVSALAERGLRLVFVEGGGFTVSRFLEAGALERLHLVIAPVLIGQGKRGLQGPPRSVMAECLRPLARVIALGTDMLWDLDLRSTQPPSHG